MATVEIYTKATCGYCAMAKRLLTSKDVSFAETDLLRQPDKRAEMIERSGGGQTVPQIFINGVPIGGFDDLSGLDMAGKLDAMLAA